jgi:hypothetical protein
MMLGVGYPKNHIVAALDATDGPAAVKALLSAQFGGNSVHLHDCARIGRIRAAIYAQRTPMQRWLCRQPYVRDEGLMSQLYGAKTITDLN